MKPTATILCTIMLMTSAACGQSLFQRPMVAAAPGNPATAAANQAAPNPVPPATVDGLPSVQQVSAYAVFAPPPRTFAANDLITIIISERTETERSSSLETKKRYDQDSELTDWIDLMSLLELRLDEGNRVGSITPALRLALKNKFQGEGERETSNEVTSRVTARIIEVKPNNTLLLESQTLIRTDGEEQLIRLSGICRAEDITANNTVQSNQMYDLDVEIKYKGDVRRASQKGLIPRVLETLFNF